MSLTDFTKSANDLGASYAIDTVPIWTIMQQLKVELEQRLPP